MRVQNVGHVGPINTAVNRERISKMAITMLLPRCMVIQVKIKRLSIQKLKHFKKNSKAFYPALVKSIYLSSLVEMRFQWFLMFFIYICFKVTFQPWFYGFDGTHLFLKEDFQSYQLLFDKIFKVPPSFLHFASDLTTRESIETQN